MPSSRPADLDAFVKEHEDHLYRTALAILGSVQEAEDAVQDAFLAYWQKAPANVDVPGAYLTRVLVNNCRSRLRAPWRRREVPLWEDLPAAGPEERAEIEELWQLSPEDRAVIHLFYYEELSTKEIAAVMKCREGTVRSRLTRARGRLRKLLEGG